MSNAKNIDLAKLAAKDTMIKVADALLVTQSNTEDANEHEINLMVDDILNVPVIAHAFQDANPFGAALLGNSDDGDINIFESAYMTEVNNTLESDKEDKEEDKEDKEVDGEKEHDEEQVVDPIQGMAMMLGDKASKENSKLIANEEEVESSDDAWEYFDTAGGDHLSEENVNPKVAVVQNIAESFCRGIGSVIEKQMAEKAGGGLPLIDSPLSNEDEISTEAKANIEDINCYVINESLLKLESQVKGFSFQAQKSLDEYKKEKGISSNSDHDDEYLDDEADDGFYEGLVNRQRGSVVLQVSVSLARNKPKILKYARRAEEIRNEVPAKLNQLIEERNRLLAKKSKKDGVNKKEDKDSDDDDDDEEDIIHEMMEEMGDNINGTGDKEGDNHKPIETPNNESNEKNNHSHYYGPGNETDKDGKNNEGDGKEGGKDEKEGDEWNTDDFYGNGNEY